MLKHLAGGASTPPLPQQASTKTELVSNTDKTMVDQIATENIDLKEVAIHNENFYRISNVDKMRPFFISVVSDSNHWMFISSNGGLTAGRKNANFALFPYYTDDKITESADITGSKTILRVKTGGASKLWEPFSNRMFGAYRTTRNLYKNVYGNKILFEEINHDLQLTFRYQWSSSNSYGFVRQSYLINDGSEAREIEMLDGIQNIIPHGVEADLQGIRSNLVDAYKKSELQAEEGLGIYALSAIIVDRAEPSEALKANTVWSLGLDAPKYLLSSLQLDAFRHGATPEQETDIKAEKGAYFLSKTLNLSAGEEKSWMIVANVNQGPSAIASLRQAIKTDNSLAQQVLSDVEAGTERLVNLVAAADGLQRSADNRGNGRHFANTLFNIMRGGIFDDNYQIERKDFEAYYKNANRKSYQQHKSLIAQLDEVFSLQTLREKALQSEDKDFTRLALEYMPLKFSRRHGDPSRPWNRFSINTQSEKDGSKVLDYEGNWRDIFQNWEALAHAYPEFIDSMIAKFLNASTFDGYNPYRVTKDGFDWEVIEEHDPWSYIGYWGDHQIIYLLKFLEFIKTHYPKRLPAYFSKDIFVYADVPYKIKSYEHILEDPKDTIIFDHKADQEVRARRKANGSDGALLLNAKGDIHRVNFVEKILATVLAKVSNFIPEAGIWLNTQRPEWNDANNALVGNGVSMVTLYYLRRFLHFLQEALPQDGSEIAISEELHQCFTAIQTVLDQHKGLLSAAFAERQRKEIMDGLGTAGSDYRNAIYAKGFTGKTKSLTSAGLRSFVDLAMDYLNHSIAANKRDDDMYHAYNLITVRGDEVAVTYLDEMLEGQVAVLSSGYLSPQESLQLLDALKASKLFREDQYSYILYPNKELSRFVDKNIVPAGRVQDSALFKQLLADGDTQLIEKDVNGNYHFNSSFNNAGSVKVALDTLAEEGYASLVSEDRSLVLQIFEEVFNHKAFTGRSGTFYGYEGLGSIYWHMVSKLLLAVEENCLRAVEEGQSEETIGRLLEHYYEILAGIGAHKSPDLYGAFPTDPYSHTPAGKGAQQPGMTGQVKEDILSRIGELGVFVKGGIAYFDPCLLRKVEFLTQAADFNYIALDQSKKTIALQPGSLAFTYCQVPVVYSIATANQVEVLYNNGEKLSLEGLELNQQVSKQLFERSGEIERINVAIVASHLK